MADRPINLHALYEWKERAGQMDREKTVRIVELEAEHEPLKVGDVVTASKNEHTRGDECIFLNGKRLTVIALFGEKAWVKETEGPLDMLFHVSRLRRVEP